MDEEYDFVRLVLQLFSVNLWFNRSDLCLNTPLHHHHLNPSPPRSTRRLFSVLD